MASEREEELEAVSTSIYFSDSTVLERIDELAAKTAGLNRNKIIVQILTRSLPEYEEDHALLLQVV